MVNTKKFRDTRDTERHQQIILSAAPIKVSADIYFRHGDKCDRGWYYCIFFERSDAKASGTEWNTWGPFETKDDAIAGARAAKVPEQLAEIVARGRLADYGLELMHAEYRRTHPSMTSKEKRR